MPPSSSGGTPYDYSTDLPLSDFELDQYVEFETDYDWEYRGVGVVLGLAESDWETRRGR
jgi:hypothetical protein